MKHFKILLLVACSTLGAQAQSDLTKANTAKTKRHIEFLASDALQGRLPGTQSEAKAADYIAQQLKAIKGMTFFTKGGLQLFDKEMPPRRGQTQGSMLHGRNVVAYVKGSKTPESYIVMGAHYDHLGLGGPGSGSRKPDTTAVHNGADDNASGVAALIESARILTAAKPECSIIFVAFSAEEKGLVGSQFFIENPPVPKESIKAMINFDMVGRLDSVLTIQGTGTAAEFQEIVQQSHSGRNFRINHVPGGFGPSDQTSFYAEKIPVLYFHTEIHEQYHTPEDDIELINLPGVAQIAELAAEITFKLSRSSQELTHVAIGTPTDMSRRGLKATLGIMPEHTSLQGLRVNAVRPGQPAENAGIQKGDTITAIQGDQVVDIESYMSLMNKYDKGEVISVEVIRDGKKQIFLVTL